MAVHGLETSVCQLHSQQTGPDVKPDESWRRSCLIDKLWKCFPHRPKVIFPLHTSCVCRWESLGCQYANTCLHRPQRGKGTGLAQSSLLQAGKTSAWTQCSGQQPITTPPPPPLLGRAVSARFQQREASFCLPQSFCCCCCLFLCVVVLSLEHWTKQEGILKQPEASILLLKGARALACRYYIWVEAMQTIHISKGHRQGGIKPAACVTHGGDRLFQEAALKHSLGRAYFLLWSS